MPTTEQLRSKLINKLKELFQLNQPDLDFGFYRIMHAKAEQVSTFIENDLLQVIQDTFGKVDETQKAQLKEAIDKEIQLAKDYGVPDPENSPKVLDARARYEAIKDSANSEAEIYDHLYRFFERYWDDGDFISRRYYTRETPGKAAPFAVPYNGEEVKLHWANADQYYIKTTEYFSNFTVNLTEALKTLKSVNPPKKDQIEAQFLQDDVTEGLKLHFRIVDATEGEHANVKASDATKRFFIIHKERPLELNDKNELIINFEYRPTTEAKKQDTLNKEALELIVRMLKEFEPRNPRKDTKTDQEGEPQNTQKDTEYKEIEDLQNTEKATEPPLQDSLSCDFVPFVVNSPLPCASVLSVVKEYLSALSTPIPTDKDKNRILLSKYINQYTARNTMDYFIHKNLGAFLKRELDFYIKNEIMRLDDIENAEAPKVEDYLAKIKVLRKIATKLIEFMAQLEDFQKKLWLKKKFVVETNYCITLDRVPEELYPQIIENQEQVTEWIKLFAIDEIEGDIVTPAYINPPTINFLKANDKLLLDTRFFDDIFKAKLISSIQGFDEQCDGLLIHSENFQALNLLRERYRETLGCIYIDPPYNTGDDGFTYKDSYFDSSWMTFILDRLTISRQLLLKGSSLYSSIDNNEVALLKLLMDYVFDSSNFVETFIWTRTYTPPALSYKSRRVAEYIHCYENQLSSNQYFGSLLDNGDAPLLNTGNPINDLDFPPGVILFKIPDQTYTASPDKKVELITPVVVVNGRNSTPVTLRGSFKWQQSFLDKEIALGTSFIVKSDKFSIRFQRQDTNAFKQPNNKIVLELDKLSGVDSNETAKKELEEMGFIGFSYPKPVSLVSKLVSFNTNPSDISLDYFAGSGTTGHSVINLNREDNGKRKYILVEMGDYFDTVLKPRIQKVVYSEKWKDGKPVSNDKPQKARKSTEKDIFDDLPCGSASSVVDKFGGISHCFKYLRLESYEDTLNNLVLQSDPIRDKAIAGNASLQEDYTLHYMLDVETGGSQSLLNIDAFNDPTSYVLKVKKPGSDEYVEKAVDLIETFNYLIGLRLVHLAEPHTLTASFTRLPDPDLPQDQDSKLLIDGDFKQVADGKWWIRKVEGWVPKNPYSPNDGLKEKVLIVWRKLTGNPEEDNLILDAWFQKNRISTLDWEFDTIYVNGSNNLPNLQQEGDTWKVRLIEEEFMKRMWDN